MMDAQPVRTALGTLQNNSADESAWEALREAIASEGGELQRSEIASLLLAARERHEARGEAEAVVRLLELTIEGTTDAGERKRLLIELSTLRLTSLFDGAGAILALKRAVAVDPEGEALRAQLEELEARAAGFREQAASYQAEAEGAADDDYRSAMLMRACEVEVCFSEEPRFSALAEDLEMALRLDSANYPASVLLEVIYRRSGDTAGLIRVLERTADRAPDLQVRVAAGVRLARLYQHDEAEPEKAARVFDRVLETDPGHPDAIAYVTEFYAKAERWDALVKVFERQLKTSGSESERLGDMLQVAMLHWKKRGVMADAEPWFAKIRSLSPAHEGMLEFYREYKASLGDDAGLAEVLESARAALGDEAPERAALEQELSLHASTQADAHREIESCKAILRENPDDEIARERLKALYKQTQGHNALVELLRQQLERTPPSEVELRTSVLRQIATVYREYVRSETALVGVLNQIVQLDGKLDEQDIDEVRELASLYERLGRPRDLLASQKMLAEIVPDQDEKKLLYRQVGRRWLEQFSNVQHAMEAFAALHTLDPEDEEAIERLEELYRKRRAWKELYALYERQLSGKQGESRIPLLREMAQLAAERLSRVSDALSFYREILDLDGSRTEVLDRFEKHAERAKDWGALADALERRLRTMPEDQAQLPILQKLGAVYADHLERIEDAIGTWRRVVQVHPGNPRAMRVLRDFYLKQERYDDLESLYREQNDMEGLAEMLSTAADRARDPKAKVDLSYRAAHVYEEGLGQSARAIRSYERILSTDPSDVRAIDCLLPLYENDEKWGRVPPLLEAKLEAATDDEEKFQILEQLVIVASRHLMDRRGAVSYARRAYERFPLDPRSMGLLDSASRASGGWEEMVSALEYRLRELGVDPSALAAEARRLSIPPARVSTPPGRSRRPTPLPSEPPPAKKRRRRRRRGGQAASEPASAPAQAAQEAPKPEATVLEAPVPPNSEQGQSLSEEVRQERRAVSLRLARILGEEMARADEAVARLKVLAQERGQGSEDEDAEALSLLENLLRRQSRPEDIRWLFEHRAGRARSSDERMNVLSEWAEFEERTFGDRPAAIGLYEKMLVLDPDSKSSLEALVRLSLEEGATSDAIIALERLRDLLDGDERAEKEVTLAGLLEAEGRHESALAAVQRALDADVEPGRAIQVLQKLVEIPQVRGDAARLLTEQYEAGGDARKEADALRAVIAETNDADEKVELILRLSAVYQHKLAEPGGALGVVIEGLRERPAELGLWDRADELAQISGRTVELADAYKALITNQLPAETLVDLARRAGKLHEDVLGDPVGAGPYYERVLSVEPDDDDAFIRLKEILTSAERWQELDSLYEREIARLEDGTRRMEMLAEVALLAEDITGDVRRAVEFHQKILELEPDYAASLDALDRLYSRLGEKEALLELLSRRASMYDAAERLLVLLRVGHLALELHQPERSMSAVEEVLEQDLTDYEARELAEKLLEIGSVRLRAARVLESIYESRDEIRDLVRVLGVRLDVLRPKEDDEPDAGASTEDERRELLRRIATLRDDRLHDDVGSFDVFAELVPLDPEDVELRERLVDSGRRLSRPQQVVDVLLSASRSAGTAALSCEILLQAAEIQNDALEDLEAAEATLGLVLGHKEEEPDAALVAARSLESLFAKTDRASELFHNLKLQIQLEQDTERKSELLARVADLALNQLGDTNAAVEAWEQRLMELPDDAEALQNLTELYEKVERYTDLKEVLVLRRDAAIDGLERMSVIRHLADVEERHLGDAERAIESYRAILDEGGAEPSVLRSLIRLYRKAERYADLAEVLQQQADVVEDRADELDALAALGRVRASKLDDVPGALEAYRRALGLDQGHEASVEALRGLLQHESAEARLESAAILEPIYEAAARAEDLYQVLTVQADATEDPTYRVELLRRTSELAESALDDSLRAFASAANGLRAAAALGDVGEWLERIDRLALATGRFAEQAALLSEVGPELFDVSQQITAQKKVAQLRATQLSDRAGAIEAYEAALELQPGDQECLSALESIYEEQKSYPELLTTLQRQEENAESEEARLHLAYRRAELLASELNDAEGAIDVYEQIIELSLEAKAVVALEGLYGSAGRYEDWAALLQRQIDAEPSRTADLRVQLASVLIQHLGQTERALDELDQTLSMSSQHVPTVTLLENLLLELEDQTLRGRVAAMLEPVYMARADYDGVLRALELRIDGSDDPDERRELITRVAKIYEEQQEDYTAALEATGRLLGEDTSDTLVTDELERLAKVAGAEARLAEMYEKVVLASDIDDEPLMHLATRAGEILVEAGEHVRALALLKRALAFSPDSRALFDLVERCLKTLQRPAERVSLYQEALLHRFEPEEQLSLIHQIAQLEREQLGSASSAIAAHQRALEIDEQNLVSLEALTVLLNQEERYQDLAELYLRRAELASLEEASTYRLLLSALYRTKLDQPDAALDQLEEIVRIVPDNAKAIAGLEEFRHHETLRPRAVEILRPLYEQADAWRKIIRLNEDRFDLSGDDHEKVQILRETAELWENRGEDAERAVRVYAEALRLVPDDEDARLEFQRLVTATGQYQTLADLYTSLLADHDDLLFKVEVLEQLALVLDRKLDDPRQALRRRMELLELEPEHEESIAASLRLATLLGDWRALETSLSRAIDASFDPGEQVTLLLRQGELRHLTLSDASGAVSAYERALEIDGRSPIVSDRLISLYEESDDAARLAELYLARIDNEDTGDELRFKLSRRAATLFELRLVEPQRAIECLNQALIAHPGDEETVSELNRLYRKEEMWPDLLDNLRLEAGTAPTPDQRLAIRHDIANILATKVESFEEAIEAYGVVLDERPDDEQAINALFRLGTKEELLAKPAADLLVPALRQTNLTERLVDALELRLTTEPDPGARVETLRMMAQLRERDCSDQKAALLLIRRAVLESPEVLELHDEAERLAAATGDWKSVADAFEAQALDLFEAELAAELFARVGKIREEQLAQPKEAIVAYQRATEQVGDRPDLLDALDRLYTQTGNTDAVVELLDRRMALADTDEAQSRILTRQGQLLLDEQNEPEEALNSLRQAVDRYLPNTEASDLIARLLERDELFDEAFEILDSVYRDRAAGQDLAQLHQRRVARASLEERLEMRRSLAEVLEQECKDPEAARGVLAQALLEDPADAGLADDIERLAGFTQAWGEASAAFLRAAEPLGEDQADVALELCRRAASLERDRAQHPDGAERALLMALKFAPEDESVLEELDGLQRTEGREKELLQTVLRRVALAGSGLKLELLRRASALAIACGDEAAAENVLRQTIEEDPDDLDALAALTDICEKNNNAEEAYSLVTRQIELVIDPGQRRKLRVHAADLARDELGREAEATELLRSIFDEEPTDPEVANSLAQAYTVQERFEELGDLLEQLIGIASESSRRAELQMKLALLRREKLDDVPGAVMLLEQLLSEDPGHEASAGLLAEIFERDERHEDLAELLQSRVAHSLEVGELEQAVALQQRYAGVVELKLADLDRAAQAWVDLRVVRDSAVAKQELYRIYGALGEQLKAARVLEEICAELDGAEGLTRRLELSQLYATAGEANEAVRVLLEAEAKLGDDEEARMQLRSAYEAISAWPELAQMLLADAERSEDASSKVRFYREAAKLYLERIKEPSSAADALQKASDLEPNNRELLLTLCDATSAAGRGSDAIVVLEQIVESFGGRRSKELGEIHRRLATAHLSLGQQEAALSELDKAFRIEPGNVHVLRQLGDVAIEVGDLKKAQQMYRALLLQRLGDDSPITKAQVFLRLGQIHKLLGESPKAKQMFERALQTDATLSEAQQELDAL